MLFQQPLPPAGGASRSLHDWLRWHGFFRPILADHIPGLKDTSIAIAGALLLFVTPVDVQNRTFLMDWEIAGRLP